MNIFSPVVGRISLGASLPLRRLIGSKVDVERRQRFAGIAVISATLR
jgi:hypothetical protein